MSVFSHQRLFKTLDSSVGAVQQKKGQLGVAADAYKVALPEETRKKLEERAGVDKARQALKPIEELRKYANRSRVSKEKRQARLRADTLFRSDSPSKWDSFIDHVQRKSYARRVAADPRADDKLIRHADQMNRLLTGSVLEVVPGDTGGSYEIRRLRGGGVGCTCNDWRFKRSVAPDGQQDCKHIRRWRASKASSAKIAMSTDEAHAILDRANIPWDNTEVFRRFSKALVGREHLDDMSGGQRKKVVREALTAFRRPDSTTPEEGDILLVSTTPLDVKGRKQSRLTRAALGAYRPATRALQGHFTHAGIFSGSSTVIEAHPFKPVQEYSLREATRRKDYIVLRPGHSKSVRRKAAREAAKEIGNDYSMLDTMGAGADLLGTPVARAWAAIAGDSPELKRGVQCGALVERSYARAGKRVANTPMRFTAPVRFLESDGVSVVTANKKRSTEQVVVPLGRKGRKIQARLIAAGVPVE